MNFDRRRVATGIRGGWLDEPVPGVLVIRDGPSTWEQRLMVVVLAAGAHGVASHRSAARLHGLDGFDGATNATIEVSVRRAFRLRPDVTAVTHHVRPMEPCDITVVKGIPCTTLQRTLCDLGSVVGDRKLVRRALTSARRRGVDLDALWATAERLHRPHQRGTGALMRILRQVPHEGTLPRRGLRSCSRSASPTPRCRPSCCSARSRTRAARSWPAPTSASRAYGSGSRHTAGGFNWGEMAETLDEDRDIAASLCGWELTYLGWYATKRPAQVLEVVRGLVNVRRRELRTDQACDW